MHFRCVPPSSRRRVANSRAARLTCAPRAKLVNAILLRLYLRLNWASQLRDASRRVEDGREGGERGSRATQLADVEFAPLATDEEG